MIVYRKTPRTPVEGTVGDRIKLSAQETYPDGVDTATLAEKVGMRTEELDASLNDTRYFSCLELVRLSNLLEEDYHWLLTGQPDPFALDIIGCKPDYNQT